MSNDGDDDNDNDKPEDDDTSVCGAHCGPECDCPCHEEPSFEDRAVQGMSDMISAAIEGVVQKLHEQMMGMSVAIGVTDDPDDADMQRSFLMATYEAMITHAAATRALLASRCGISDEVMADRAGLMLDIGRAEVAASGEEDKGDGEEDAEAKEDRN
jgi:hypothetical protein